MVLGAAAHTAGTHPTVRRIAWLAHAAEPDFYVIPVKGVPRKALRSSFGAPRSGGRKHHGIDIMAKRGTAVLAAADGFVISTRPNRLGGTVVWILGSRGITYYYAHLDRIREGVRAGRFVLAGEVIGTVGDSGNAKGGPPHLHFGIYQNGPRDPYPLLRP
ncbi:MAG TPA: M23 family metallopeptidase [Terriglobales bacterium]|nr:M23 family metallopeptidase [Terriglobales bacterium]